MNTQSTPAPVSPSDAAAGTPAPMAPTRPLVWSVRRELWENRSITLAPLAAAGVFLLGYLISVRHLAGRMGEVAALDPSLQPAKLAEPYCFAAAMIMFTGALVGVFYCLDALHGERRDRSILFWKSLPVSDMTTVLSKAAVPLVVLPLLTWAIATATQLFMLLLSTAVLQGAGASATPLWEQWPWFEMPLLMLYCAAVLALWYAPIWSWLLLVSAWARRSTFLWAVLPPLAIMLLEKIAFGTTHFANLLTYRVRGTAEAFAEPVRAHHALVYQFSQLDPARFVTRPGLWLGLLFAAAVLVATARLRRYRTPI